MQNETLIAIKAPLGTTLEVPDPDEVIVSELRVSRDVIGREHNFGAPLDLMKWSRAWTSCCGSSPLSAKLVAWSALDALKL